MMKPNKKFFTQLFAPALLVVLLMSFTLAVKELPMGDKASITTEVTMDDAKDHCCCPPGWTLSGYNPTGPVLPYDSNGDGFVCSKGFFPNSHPSGDTPNGKGNLKALDGVNVKDNNNPCDDGEFNPCTAP